MGGRAEMVALLADALVRDTSGDLLAVRLCRACVEILGADGGAMTLSSTTPERLTISTSNGLSARLDDLEEVLGEGPGRQAFVEGRAVVLRVGGEGMSRFPIFSPAARDAVGRVTVFAVPMRPGGRTIGVVTLYSAAGSLRYGLEDAQFLAGAVGAGLLGSPEATPDAGWQERARTHQATGMVVAQLGVGPEDALALLRSHAFALGTTLGAVARTVVEREISFSRDPAAPDGIVALDHQWNEKT